MEHLRWLLLNFIEYIFYKAPQVAASVLSNSLVLFKKTGSKNTMLLKYIYTSSKFLLPAIYCLILLQSKGGKRKKHKACFMFRYTFFP